MLIDGWRMITYLCNILIGKSTGVNLIVILKYRINPRVKDDEVEERYMHKIVGNRKETLLNTNSDESYRGMAERISMLPVARPWNVNWGSDAR